MKKEEAIKQLGGSARALASEVGISVQAVNQWPDELPIRLRDRVQAALWRRHLSSSAPQPKTEAGEAQ